MRNKNKNKNILLVILGLSPAIITEALYVLVVQQKIRVDELYVITTARGKNGIENVIFGENGALKKFYKEYPQDYEVKFNEKMIFVAKDEESVFLDDIATTSDNRYFPNLVFKKVNQLTRKENTTLYACLAGGRKTMSFYLGAAMMRFGRENDVLFHVLVSEQYQRCEPKFYFPTKKDVLAYFNGKKVNFKDAKVVFAKIPFFSLREKLPNVSIRSSYANIVHKDKEVLELFRDSKITEFKDVTPKSPAFREVLFKIRNLKPGSIILLLGETGTGKELVARYISELFQNGKMITFNVARSGSDQLFRSELFGYRKGAFTGAIRDTKGYVDIAREKEAVLFLDEIDKISVETQHTLLRFLETREYSRIGDSEKEKFEGTIVLAGNEKKFEERLNKGEILEDFYYRVSTHKFNIPPLRERPEDILLLTNYYIEKYNKKYGKNFQDMDKKFKDFLFRYSWPGNIRDLQKLLESIIPHYSGNKLLYEFIPEEFKKKIQQPEYRIKTDEDFHKEKYQEILRKHKGNISAAARELNIPSTTFRSRLKKYGINPQKFKI